MLVWFHISNTLHHCSQTPNIRSWPTSEPFSFQPYVWSSSTCANSLCTWQPEWAFQNANPDLNTPRRQYKSSTQSLRSCMYWQIPISPNPISDHFLVCSVLLFAHWFHESVNYQSTTGPQHMPFLQVRRRLLSTSSSRSWNHNHSSGLLWTDLFSEDLPWNSMHMGSWR